MNPLPLSNEQLQCKRELAQLDKQLVEFVAAARPLHEEDRALYVRVWPDFTTFLEAEHSVLTRKISLYKAAAACLTEREGVLGQLTSPTDQGTPQRRGSRERRAVLRFRPT
jgi:hypothetical protein